MAESLVDQNHEALLRDSLEICIGEYDSFSSSTIRTKTHDTIKEPTSISSPNDLAKDNSSMVEREQKPRTDIKKPVKKPKPTKNIIELNKINVTKGRMKTSYGKMHQKKHGMTAPKEKQTENGVCEDTSNLSLAAAELRKQLVSDGILTEEDELDSVRNYQDLYYGVEETNPLSGSHETNMSQFHGGYSLEESNFSNNVYQRGIDPNVGYKHMQRNTNGTLIGSHVHGSVSQPRFPPVRHFTASVQSAPADMLAYQDPVYENAYRSSSLQYASKPDKNYAHDLNSSMNSLASTNSGSTQEDSLTYSGIYANSKHNARTNNYKPYTLGDYKRLKKQSKPGGLGPDTKTDEHQQKAKKAIRQKEYAAAVKQRYASENNPSKKKRTPTTQGVSAQKQEANTRRMKALEYAKAIPKPASITSRTQTVWRCHAPQAAEEPQTLLDILQQRHQDEKKAIDAMRKDLQTKLKTK